MRAVLLGASFPTFGVVSERLDVDLHTVLDTYGVRLLEEDIVSVAIDLLRAVLFLHDRGDQGPIILHRGITTRNVLFQGTQCRLGDLLPSVLRPLRKRQVTQSHLGSVTALPSFR